MNPMQMIQLMRGNPQAFIQQISQNPKVSNNPMAMNALDMIKSNDTAGLKQMAENLCSESGTTPDAVKQDILSQIGLM